MSLALLPTASRLLVLHQPQPRGAWRCEIAQYDEVQRGFSIETGFELQLTDEPAASVSRGVARREQHGTPVPTRR